MSESAKVITIYWQEHGQRFQQQKAFSLELAKGMPNVRHVLFPGRHPGLTRAMNQRHCLLGTRFGCNYNTSSTQQQSQPAQSMVRELHQSSQDLQFSRYLHPDTTGRCRQLHNPLEPPSDCGGRWRVLQVCNLKSPMGFRPLPLLDWFQSGKSENWNAPVRFIAHVPACCGRDEAAGHPLPLDRQSLHSSGLKGRLEIRVRPHE